MSLLLLDRGLYEPDSARSANSSECQEPTTSWCANRSRSARNRRSPACRLHRVVTVTRGGRVRVPPMRKTLALAAATAALSLTAAAPAVARDNSAFSPSDDPL